MIKVNLLTSTNRTLNASSDFQESPADQKEIQKQGLVKLILILIPVLGLYAYEFQNIPTLAAERARLQSTLSTLKSYNSRAEASVREVKNFKQGEEKIQKRIEALEKLSKSRTNEIKILKLLGDVIPARAWLNSVVIGQGRANIVGLALTNSDVNGFADRLKSNILVADLQLVRIAEERIDNGPPLTRFEFNCLIERRK